MQKTLLTEALAWLVVSVRMMIPKPDHKPGPAQSPEPKA